MAILRIFGILLIIAWLVLFLWVKVVFAAIHLLLAIGVILLVMTFFTRARSSG